MQNIAGTGMTVPFPGNLYPSQLAGAPIDAPTNYLTLQAGAALAIPAQSSQYLIDLGLYCDLEFLDPTTGIWRPMVSGASQPGMVHMQSDGVTKRIVNRLGCPMGAIVAGGGTGFAQATATITANVGGSTWQPIVGGSLSVSSVTAAGALYTVPPLVLIPAPAPAGTNGSLGGVQATARAVLTSGTVSSVTLVNEGAGYQSAPIAVLVPSQFDVNVGSITQASITLVLNAANSAKITAALCTNHGAPLATISALTLTAAGGAGAGATITPQVLQTITSASIVAGGVGWGTATAPAMVRAMGGAAVSVAAISNPNVDMSTYQPSQLAAVGTTNAGGTITAVAFPNGGGAYLSTPTAALASGGTIPSGAASVTFVMGFTYDTIMLQPL